MTLALLLALNGRKILLLEKSTQIGGSLCRFYKEGVPFDTGFHFTGGFAPGGILEDMLYVLGFGEQIKPIFLSGSGSTIFVFEEDGITYDMPYGLDNFRHSLYKYFPADTVAIDKYFELVKKVRLSTVTLELRNVTLSAQPIEEDFISLEDKLNSLTTNYKLKGLLSTLCLCYGASPKEISFANHARVASGMYDAVARIENGGEAVVKAFRKAFATLNIDIRCNTTIAECSNIVESQVKEFILSNGDVVCADDCTFTIHPHEVLKILPRQHLKKAFIERVSSFEPTNGFFSVFGVVRDADPRTFGTSVASLIPSYDLNSLLDPQRQAPGALAVISSVETSAGKTYCVINAFEPEFFSRLQQWADSSIGNRPAAYYEYKEAKVREIKERISKLYPQYRSSFEVLDAATVLTFRDYLSSPEGNAYGIKQKIGQFNLFGKQSLTNIYVAGQSAVLPGLVGAMLSSFIIARTLVGKDDYTNFIEKRLCHLEK